MVLKRSHNKMNEQINIQSKRVGMRPQRCLHYSFTIHNSKSIAVGNHLGDHHKITPGVSDFQHREEKHELPEDKKISFRKGKKS
jgi:hypothetical protein